MPENFEMQADFSIFVRMDRGEIIIYRTADGETRLEVRMESDSVWLTQAQIARLFGVDRTVIVRHVNNMYILIKKYPTFQSKSIPPTNKNG